MSDQPDPDVARGYFNPLDHISPRFAEMLRREREYDPAAARANPWQAPYLGDAGDENSDSPASACQEGE